MINKVSPNEPRTTKISISFNIRNNKVIPYGEYIHEQQYSSQNLDWSFRCSKNYIGIKVWLMELDEFESFQHGGGYGAFILSGGEHSQDAGRYDLYHADDWVVVFFNEDNDQETVTVSYELRFDEIDPYSILSSIIAFSTVIVVISIIVYIIKKRNRDIQ